MVASRGISQPAVQTLHGRARWHGGQRGAPEVSGALVVAAGLLEAGGKGQNLRIVRKAVERLAQPGFSLGHVGGQQGRPDGSLEVA